MEIHGVKIIGNLTPNFIKTIRKIEFCTPYYIWKGIKAIYVTNYKDTNTSRTGAYVSGTVNKNERVKVCLGNSTFNLKNKDLPFIYINTYNYNDEWNFAFILLHEVGHHIGIKQEYKAHLFSLKYVKSFIYTRKQIHKYYSEKEINWKYLYYSH